MDATTITIDCWVYGDDVENIFPINISSTQTFGTLRNTLRDELPEFRTLDVRELCLYSIRVTSSNLEEELRSWTPTGNRKLGGKSRLSTLLPDVSEWVIIVDGPRADMTLNCWVRGEQMHRTFPISISSAATVASLQNTIKSELAEEFRGIDAKALDLYRIPLLDNKPVLDDDTLKDTLGPLSIAMLGDRLRASQRLTNVFGSVPPKDDHLHLVIDGVMPIQCWIQGKEVANSFGVRISMRVMINDLKNAITAARGTSGVPPDRLRLYKVQIGDKLELHEIVHTPGVKHLLEGDMSLGEIFRDVPFSQLPRVVVELPRNAPISSAAPSDLLQIMEYLEELDRAPPGSPSEQGKSSNFVTFQSTKRGIAWTRPPERTSTIPITLLHPILGKFVDDCATHVPTHDDNTFVLDLVSQMSKFFDTENERQEAFMAILHKHKLGMLPSSISKYTTDRDMHVNGRRYVFLEVKSEVGSTGAEPYCQAILYFLAATRNEMKKGCDDGILFNFPCLIITLFGPHLSFSGAVWSNRPNYEVLSTTLPLFWHPTNITLRQCAARHVGAFMKACVSLRKLYKNFDKTPSPYAGLQLTFPHPRCYTRLDSENKESFRYISTLDSSKLVFIVRTDAGERLCVKFVRTYSPAVHLQCAYWDIAPSLRGFSTIEGGWQMVIMELLEGYERLFDIKDTFSAQDKDRLKEELTTRLTELHQMNLVHGDVRDTNVMVSEDRSRWNLVDFDWSGEIGSVRYPMNVNPDLRRPKDALDGKLILADHDIEMLDYLFE